MAALKSVEKWTVVGEKIEYKTVDGVRKPDTKTRNFEATAKSAKALDINPEEVEKAINKLKSTASNSLKGISSSLESISAGAGRDALSVQDATMAPVISEASGQLNSVVSMIDSACGEVMTFAISEHNKRQTQYNDEAQREAEGKCSSAGYTARRKYATPVS